VLCFKIFFIQASGIDPWVILLHFESFPFCFEQRECTVSFPRFQGNIQKNSSCWKGNHVGVSEVGISGVKQFPI